MIHDAVTAEQVVPRPQLSRDGMYFWDGARWVAAPLRTPRFSRIIGLGVILALCIGGIFAGLFWTGALPTSCTVGLAGTAVNITIQGVGAGGACNSPLPFDQGAYAADAFHENSFGDVVCVVPSARDSAPNGANTRGLTYVVRDTGFQIIGTGVCELLREAIAS